MEISCQRFRIFLSYRYSRPNDLNWSCAWFLSGGVTVSSAIGVRQIALDRDYGNCPSSNLRPQVEGAHSRCTQHKHRCTKIICLHTDTSAHKHRCKHRCTQWGLEWLWKQESVGRSWGVTVRCPCTLYTLCSQFCLSISHPWDRILPHQESRTFIDFCCTIPWSVYVVCLPFLGLCTKLWVVRG